MYLSPTFGRVFGTGKVADREKLKDREKEGELQRKRDFVNAFGRGLDEELPKRKLAVDVWDGDAKEEDGDKWSMDESSSEAEEETTPLQPSSLHFDPSTPNLLRPIPSSFFSLPPSMPLRKKNEREGKRRKKSLERIPRSNHDHDPTNGIAGMFVRLPLPLAAPSPAPEGLDEKKGAEKVWRREQRKTERKSTGRSKKRRSDALGDILMKKSGRSLGGQITVSMEVGKLVSAKGEEQSSNPFKRSKI
ncbi:hypothetical protein BT69DRAFT_1281656 [Atractiella rhizophila]|nr:hypothetical protein BT69DRAFT_1281656 [Atractiella rhizophila]